MTERIHSLTVVLDKEIREDDAEYLINAIRMLRGVIKVDSNIVDYGHYAAKEQAKYDLRKELRDILWK